MPDDLTKLKSDVETLQRDIIRERAEAATSRSWVKGIGAAILAWLGITSFYHIPKSVKDSNIGQVAAEAESARERATESANEASKGAIQVQQRLIEINRGNLIIGTIPESRVVTVPDGTTDDWDMILVPQKAGYAEATNIGETDNALLEFSTVVQPTGDKKAFAAEFLFRWKGSNQAKDITGENKGAAAYILRRKALK